VRVWLALTAVALSIAGCGRGRGGAAPQLTIGSKEFPESIILANAMAILATGTGAQVDLKTNLGGTEVVYQALAMGSVDAYPDYTGTIAQVLMKAPGRPTADQMRAFLAGQGIGMSDPLGFNDGYALAVMPATQAKYGLRKISDLAAHPDLRLGFTHEFIRREDGWVGLSQAYRLAMSKPTGMQHQLAYTAIASGQIDVMEIYTTDSKIEKMGLRLLEDDRGFFPRYDAVILYRLDLPRRAPLALAAMRQLVGKIDERHMMRANALVEIRKQPAPQAARSLLQESLPGRAAAAGGGEGPQSLWAATASEIGRDTLQHLKLVAISLLAAILVGVPLGVLATRSRWLATLTLSGTGLLQTIPSLALFAFLIPLFGIGPLPAVLALFLYGLLPIVRNTYTGLQSIPPNLVEAAEALGLTPRAQLFRISLPMASPAISAGVKTSAVINVGTATIAAFIGAGGLGDLIKSGIDLQRTDLLLEGAIPAALLALLVQWGFDLLDRVLIPRGLRLPASGS
jgi:osmoprotectant transport system permease protein